MKFKFDPNDVSIKTHINFMYEGDIQAAINDATDIKILSKPECIPDAAVREGTYSIRQKGSYEEVEFFAGYWFDKGKWPTDFAVHNFMLFPSLPDSEYVQMKKYRNRLSKEWAKNVDGYFRWKELRQMSRNIKMWHRQYL